MAERVREARRRASIAARDSPRATVVDLRDGPLLRLDAEGRWSGLADGGQHLRRTVDGRVLEVVAGGFRPLAADAADEVHRRASRVAARMASRMRTAAPGEIEVLGSLQEVIRKLTTSAAWTPESYAEQRRRFLQAYPEPVPILPPHRYRDLVVLPAVGCPNHGCNFCDFYRGRRFAVLDDEAFETHLQAVLALFGAAAAERGGVFLGSGAALAVPDRMLLQRLARIAELLAALERGVGAFHDPDRGRARGVDQWLALRQAGLTDVTAGLETGLPELRKAAGKSPDLAQFSAAVREMAGAGITVAITVLVGLGGRAAIETHRRATVEVLAAMGLSEQDRVYLSPLAGSMAEDELQAELRDFREALRSRTAARIGAYLVSRFAYFA